MTVILGDLADLPTADLALMYLADRPLTISRLAQRCGVSRREMEAALESLATSGRHAIVADGSGIRLARDADDLADYVERLRMRLAHQYRRVRSLRQVERRMRYQQQLEIVW